MKTLKIMFLAAGKRLSLLECFQAAAATEGVELSMYAVEWTRRSPIANIASIIEGPKFESAGSDEFLLETARRLKIDVVVPNSDPATILLSKLKKQLAESGTWAVVSDADLCAGMYDKIEADAWFRRHEIAVPEDHGLPLIVKNRFGSGAKDQIIARHEDELHAFFAHRNRQDYIVQTLVPGQEFSVDAYLTRTGRVLGALTRKRIAVSDGEVDVSETFRHEGILNVTARVLSIEGWEGPITLQFIEGPKGPVMIEVNPRFGGGVTHSIHCGLDMPRWILRERLELPLDPAPEWPDGSFMTRSRRDTFHDNIG